MFHGCNYSQLGNIPLCKYHIIFINFFSVEEHLGNFQFQTITNRAAVNMLEKMLLLWDEASFDYMHMRGIDQPGGRLILIFWECTTLISVVSVHDVIPTRNGCVFSLFHILYQELLMCAIVLSHYHRCKMKSQNSYDLQFLVTKI